MATTTSSTVSAATTAAPKAPRKRTTAPKAATPATPKAPKVETPKAETPKAAAPKATRPVEAGDLKPSTKNEFAMVAAKGTDMDAVLTAASKKPSELHENMKRWLEDNGAENVDLETVKLVCALRHTFQRSEANQDHLGDRRQAAEAKAAARVAAAQERAAKAVAKAEALAKAAAKK